MRILAIVLSILLIVSTCPAQAPGTDSQQGTQTAPPASESGAAPSSQTVIVPAGTQIPATLASPIMAKTAKPGRTVRAVTAFPVTVGSQIAIPVGTYFEGVIDKVTKNRSTGPRIEMHFTRIVFANGYTVNVDAASQSADAAEPDAGSVVPASFRSGDAPHLVLAAQQAPQPPPLSHPGLGAAIGIGVGLAAAGVVAFIIAAHHGSGYSGVLFDEGWQFDLVLQRPLSLNPASIAADSGAATGA
ncbi:MAG TPA: hypothetical protein VMD78_07255 [Candidatus Baltobacteraceae bacterium]|nr:hypothetical protein [Candidatus Baltobacteraceae bacterium]